MSHIPYYGSDQGDEPRLVPPCPPTRRTVVELARASAARHPYAYLWAKPSGEASGD